MAGKNLSEAVYSRLSERILRWDYMPGHRFTEEGLCAEFRVSRSPVREALNILAENGLVEKVPKRGYSVRTLDFKQIDELYELRLAIEEYVVARICRQGMDEGRIGSLYAEWSGLRDRLPETGSLVPAADEAFHEALSLLTGNGTLIAALKDIDRRIHFVRLSDITSPERVEATCAEHLELLARIRARDEAGAVATLRSNIEGGRSAVERAIQEALAHAYRNKAE